MSIESRKHNPALSIDLDWSPRRAPGSLFELFRSPEGDSFVDLYVQGHRETYLLTSEQFRDRLGLVLLERTGEAPTTAELKRHIEVLRLKAVRQETPVREVYVRTARVDDRITLTAPTTVGAHSRSTQMAGASCKIRRFGSCAFPACCPCRCAIGRVA